MGAGRLIAATAPSFVLVDRFARVDEIGLPAHARPVDQAPRDIAN